MNIAILGTGAYGLSLATMATLNNHNITLWNKNEFALDELKKHHTNNKVLPNVVLPNSLKYTDNLEEAVRDAELIIYAVPAGAVDSVSRELSKYYNNQHICLASKGIEQDTCLFVCDVLEKYIKTDKVAIISGPSFAIDIVKKVPIGLSLATRNVETERIIKE